MTNFSTRKSNLFIILAGFFVCNAVLAEIIGVKIFSGETTLGLPPAQIPLLGSFVLDFNLTAGAIIWPVVFVITDLINEYYGKDGVRKLSILTAVLISYVFIVIWFATSLPPADFWLEINKTDRAGNAFNINTAFSTLFGQGLGIIIGSITAFLLAQLLDAFIFQKLRERTGEKMIWLRATGSTVVSQVLDSFLVLFIAFYLFGNWKMEQVIAVAIINYIYKLVMAVLLTPLIYLAHHYIDKYLEKEKSLKSK